MNILYLAYACEPGAGSEYGVGWMVPATMARLHPEHEVWVMTRRGPRDNVNAKTGKKAKEERVAEAIAAMRLENMHIAYYDQPRWMTYPNEMQSRWGEQINYLVWQWMVRGKVKRLVREQHIDVVHHLTFNQYRTPSPGYWMQVPFVVGPIGGAETIAQAFWQDLEPHTLKKERIRLKGKDLKIFRWFNTRARNKKIILCSSAENARRLTPFSNGNETRVLPAIAYDPADFVLSAETNAPRNDAFEMVYAGKALDWKGLLLFLRALNRLACHSARLRVKLIGIRFEDEQRKVNAWLHELGLEGRVELIPFMERSKLLTILQRCNLSVYPAFRDSGSMSVLEACAVGCPTICFDAGGQDAFPDEVVMKVSVGENYESCLSSFAQRLQWAMEHPDEVSAMGRRAQQWAEQNMTWERRIEAFVNIYKDCLVEAKN